MEFIERQIGLIPQKIIGRGAFGIVYQCIDTNDNQIYAVKIINKSKMPRVKLRNWKKQGQILQSFEHPNIVKLHSFKETSQLVFLKMEYVPHGTLKSFMKNKFQNNDLSVEEVAVALKALLLGLSQIHKYNIIHRDIKPCIKYFTAASN